MPIEPLRPPSDDLFPLVLAILLLLIAACLP